MADFTIAFWWNDLEVGKSLKVFRPWIVSDYDVYLDLFPQERVDTQAVEHGGVYEVVSLAHDHAIIERKEERVKIKKDSLWYFGLEN